MVVLVEVLTRGLGYYAVLDFLLAVLIDLIRSLMFEQRLVVFLARIAVVGEASQYHVLPIHMLDKRVSRGKPRGEWRTYRRNLDSCDLGKIILFVDTITKHITECSERPFQSIGCALLFGLLEGRCSLFIIVTVSVSNVLMISTIPQRNSYDD